MPVYIFFKAFKVESHNLMFSHQPYMLIGFSNINILLNLVFLYVIFEMKQDKNNLNLNYFS